MFATLHAGIGVKQTHSYARSLILNGSYELGEDAYFLTPAGKVRPKGMDETR